MSLLNMPTDICAISTQQKKKKKNPLFSYYTSTFLRRFLKSALINFMICKWTRTVHTHLTFPQ